MSLMAPTSRHCADQATPTGLRRSVRLFRLFLAERLPESWLPAAFVPVERFPVTAGGSLDETRLPAPPMTAP